MSYVAQGCFQNVAIIPFVKGGKYRRFSSGGCDETEQVCVRQFNAIKKEHPQTLDIISIHPWNVFLPLYTVYDGFSFMQYLYIQGTRTEQSVNEEDFSAPLASGHTVISVCLCERTRAHTYACVCVQPDARF